MLKCQKRNDANNDSIPFGRLGLSSNVSECTGERVVIFVDTLLRRIIQRTYKILSMLKRNQDMTVRNMGGVKEEEAKAK